MMFSFPAIGYCVSLGVHHDDADDKDLVSKYESIALSVSAFRWLRPVCE